jgi:hypothetical protein
MNYLNVYSSTVLKAMLPSNCFEIQPPFLYLPVLIYLCHISPYYTLYCDIPNFIPPFCLLFSVIVPAAVPDQCAGANTEYRACPCRAGYV